MEVEQFNWLSLINDLLKMLLNIHEEYSQVLDDDKRAGEDDCLMT